MNLDRDKNTLSKDESDTFVHTKPWDHNDHAQVQAESEITYLEDADTGTMERTKRTRKRQILISFDFSSQDKHLIESRNQANQMSMKYYAVKFTDPNYPTIGKCEYPATQLPPLMDIVKMPRFKFCIAVGRSHYQTITEDPPLMKMLICNDYEEKIGLIKALEKEFNTIPGSGVTKKKGQASLNYVVVYI
jgi:hypothetical protein